MWSNKLQIFQHYVLKRYKGISYFSYVEKAGTQYYKIGAASQTNKEFRFWKKYYSYGFLTFIRFFLLLLFFETG